MKEIKIFDKVLQFNCGNFGDVENLFEILNIEAEKLKTNFYKIIQEDKEIEFCSKLVYGNKAVRDEVLKCSKNCKIDNQEFCYSYFVGKQHLYFPALLHSLLENIYVFLVAPSSNLNQQ